MCEISLLIAFDVKFVWKSYKKVQYHFLLVPLMSSMYFLTRLSMSYLMVMGIECLPLC